MRFFDSLIDRGWRRGMVAAVLGVAACSPATLVEVEPSSTLVDPSTVATAAGATQLYNFAMNTFAARLGGTGNQAAGNNNFIVAVALFTDEMLRTQVFNTTIVGVDERTGTQSAYAGVYNNLHQPRIGVRQAREALQRYATGTSPALQGELYALEGYTLIYFAELFCSGIPLTTVPLDQPAVPTAGFTMQELLERAVALFDSAMISGVDSARFVHLARVGQGRALLGLGRFTEAAEAVSGVPTDFTYVMEFDITASTGQSQRPVNEIGSFVGPSTVWRMQVMDNEGENGLVWSTDPRTGVRTSPTQMGPTLLPAKYSRTSAGVIDPTVTSLHNPIRVADGVEARLIEAEAALSSGGASWLATLNALRATCVGAALCAPVPGIAATALPPLADPGNAAARLDLLMRERAMWLYLTGHRQGDLRRLARIYDRDPGTLWPTGTYVNAGFPPFTQAVTTHGTSYGSDVVFKPNASEQLNNPRYAGCFDLDP